MPAAPHIFTLTGNLLAEHTLEFAAWAAGKTQRAARASFQVGGKGINVSKMLTRLGASNTALCFTGGASGSDCEAWLREKKFSFVRFASDRATRLGTVVRAPGVAETTFLGPDVPPSPAAIATCAAFLDAQPDGQILAICGSIPGWNDASFDVLRAAFENWIRRALLVVDTYGPPLAWFAARPVALIKINATELATLAPAPGESGGAGFTPSTSESCGAGFTPATSSSATLAAASSRSPVARWIVSDGPADVWFCERHSPPTRLSPPRIVEISATGSGDVLLACVLHAHFLHGEPLAASVARALPYAAANAAHPGVAEFSLDTLPGVSGPAASEN